MTNLYNDNFLGQLPHFIDRILGNGGTLTVECAPTIPVEMRPCMDAFATFLCNDISNLESLEEGVGMTIRFGGREGIITAESLEIFGAVTAKEDLTHSLLSHEDLVRLIDRILRGAVSRRNPKDNGVHIINLTPHTVTVYSTDDVTNNGHGSFVLRDEMATPRLIVLPSEDGPARAVTKEEQAGVVDGVPVYRTHFGEVENLPPHTKGTFYIVSAIAAQAARRCGRTTDDLLIPSRLVRSADGTVIGCCGFAELV